MTNHGVAVVSVHPTLLRGERRPRVALVGRSRIGKSTIFQDASSVVVHHERLAGVDSDVDECIVEVGLDQILLVDLPSIQSSRPLREMMADAPGGLDVLIHVMDATALERDLALDLELASMGMPLVIALNRVDEARAKGLFINVRALSERLGVPVVPTVAHMGKGILALFEAAVSVARNRTIPHPFPEESLPDRHHRAALLFEAVTSLSGPEDTERWKRWLDELFLHPRWGLIGSLGVFALVLFMVFEVSVMLDTLTSARLVEWVGQWQPASTAGVVGRAVADGLIGLIGIVVPYMLPLVILLVALEESGIMHRVAFVVDRGFHRIGLHGGAAVPFLMGLGCNVPAISAAAAATTGRDRVVASLLITFVPCSARSAILLALGGKYLGGLGVFAIFLLTLVVIAVAGRLLARRYSQATPGMIQEIPSYALPAWNTLWRNTWARTRDIVTIVTPLLVAGSVVLALLNHVGADAIINMLLTPVTSWWLGLPVALGVPILFGVLRKELSLLMIYQALGTMDIAPVLDRIQIMTFLVFLTFYIPCVSTFAIMLKTVGRREALFSVALSVGVALAVAGATRLLLEVVRTAVA